MICERLLLKQQCVFLKTSFFTGHFKWRLLTVLQDISSGCFWRFYKTFQVAASDGFTGHFKWLFLTILGFQHTALLNKRLGQKCLSLNFEKLRTSSVRTPPIDCFFCLSVNMRNFSDNVFYRAPLRNYLFHLPSKHLLVLKTSSKSLQRNNFSSSKTSWRRLEMSTPTVNRTCSS